MRRLYSLLHKIAYKRVELRREALFFTVFFLSAAVIWLIAAACLVIAGKHGMCEYLLIQRYLPLMARSALLSVPLAVAGGLILDLQLRDNS